MVRIRGSILPYSNSGRLTIVSLPDKITTYFSAEAASLAITFLRVAMPTTVPIIIAATITKLGATEIKLYLSIERSLVFFNNNFEIDFII